MIEGQWNHLLELARSTLKDGKKIVVFGWQDSNHNPDTRDLEKTGRVVFIINSKKGRRPKQIPNCLIVTTRFVDKNQHRILEKSRDSILFKGTLQIAEIKDLLGSCADLIFTQGKPNRIRIRKKHTIPQEEAVVEVCSTRAEEPNTVHVEEQTQTEFNETPSTPTEETVPMTTDIYVTFKNRFVELAHKHDDQLVSSALLKPLLKELGIKKSPQVMIREGYVTAIKRRDAIRASWYKLGPKLGGKEATKEADSVLTVPEPTDPIEKARYLCNMEETYRLNEAKLKEELEKLKLREAEIKKELEATGAQLVRVNTAKEILQKLKDV